MKLKNFCLILVAILIAASAAVSLAEVVTTPAESIRLELDLMEISVAKGKTQKLAASLVGAEMPKKAKIQWTTSDKTIATVQNGVVKGVAAGEATITASLDLDDTTLTAESKVIVILPVTSVKADSAKLTVMVGESASPQVKVTPEGATNKKLTWASSDTVVAEVDAEGRITAVGGGTVTVTYTTTDGSKKSGKISVFVPTISALGTEHSITEPGRSQLPVTYYGKDPDGLTAKVKNQNVLTAEMDSGALFVKPVSAGETTIELNDKSSKASKLTLKVSVAESAIIASQKIEILSAVAFGLSEPTIGEIQVRNNSGKVIVEVHLRIMLINADGTHNIMGSNGLDEYSNEYLLSIYDFEEAWKHGEDRILDLNMEGPGYSDVRNVKAAVTKIVFSDGTVSRVPESNLHWFSGESGYAALPLPAVNIAPLTAEELEMNGSFSMGLSWWEVYPEYTQRYARKFAGLWIISVAPGSISEMGGIQVGDTVFSVDGVRFVDDPLFFERAKARIGNGEESEFLVERNGEEIALTLRK